MPRVKGRRQIDKSLIHRILVRATNWVGDGVMTLPALEAVRRNFPSSSITVLAKPWVLSLFEAHPAVDHVMPFEKGEGAFTGLGEMLRIIRLIRKEKFDLAILFQNAFEAALLTCLGGVRLRLGYNTDSRGLLLTHGVIRDNEVLKVHQVEYYLSILRAMDWEAKGSEPSLHVRGKNREEAMGFLASEGIRDEEYLIGLGPGAIFGGSKRWPPGRFARIGEWAAERWGARILLFGSSKEREICEEVAREMGHTPVNFCGRTSLGEAMGLINLCQLFVTNDSGLMHVSAALGVPTVAIFGSTDPNATGPGGLRTMVVRHDVECAPCMKPECPTHHRCMLSIEPEVVWEAMAALKGETE
ncbi:MAG: lipopolysaccharide heptosyltransferase II [Desulfobacteraceae bacterium]|nr:lipopolysaccharide heptosyltransferase II [Desulfobacteraceae bacterium]